MFVLCTAGLQRHPANTRKAEICDLIAIQKEAFDKLSADGQAAVVSAIGKQIDPDRTGNGEDSKPAGNNDGTEKEAASVAVSTIAKPHRDRAAYNAALRTKVASQNDLFAKATLADVVLATDETEYTWVGRKDGRAKIRLVSIKGVPVDKIFREVLRDCWKSFGK